LKKNRYLEKELMKEKVVENYFPPQIMISNLPVLIGI